MDGKVSFCRICLQPGCTKNIFEEQNNVLIFSKIVYCTSIQVSQNDLLPKSICDQCLVSLDIAYTFKMSCESTDTKLRSLLMKNTAGHSESINDNVNNLESSNDLFIQQYIVNKPLEENNLSKEHNSNVVEDSCSRLGNQNISSADSIIQFSVPKVCTNSEHSLVVLESEENVCDKALGKIYFAPDELKPKDTKSKVGRHIAKKIAGKLPQRFHHNITTNIDKPQLDDNNLNDPVVVENEDIFENNVPMMVAEETVITDENCSLEIRDQEIYLAHSQDSTVDIDCNKQSASTISNKLKSKVANKKYKIKLKVDNRKVNVFRDRVTDYKQKHKTKYQKKNTSENTVENVKKFKEGFKCDICNKLFSFRSHLKRHLTKHTGTKSFSCNFCSQKFANKYNLTMHMAKHTGEFALKCEICNKGLPNPSLLKRHMTSHTGEQNFQCRYCPVKFRQSSSLRSHERMHLVKPSYQCDICFKVFSYSNSLNAHKKLHFEAQRFPCDICSSTFSRRSSLVRHKKDHTDLKVIKCTMCDQMFYGKADHNAHLRSHSKYKCEICGEGFRYKSNFTLHLEDHK